jgi:hypothetical protein
MLIAYHCRAIRKHLMNTQIMVNKNSAKHKIMEKILRAVREVDLFVPNTLLERRQQFCFLQSIKQIIYRINITNCSSKF